MESTFEKIIRKSGFKPVECKCNVCKSQCHVPCFGTPEDISKLIKAGYAKRLQALKLDGYIMITPLKDATKNACTFFTNGLCELHASGLKPTVGKLAHHSTTLENYNPQKSPSYFVTKEWENLSQNDFKELLSGLKNDQ